MDVLPFALPDISRTEVAAVTECLELGWLTSGRKVQEFEAAFVRRAFRLPPIFVGQAQDYSYATAVASASALRPRKHATQFSASSLRSRETNRQFRGRVGRSGWLTSATTI